MATIFVSYTTLLVEVLAIATGGAVLAMVAPGIRRSAAVPTAGAALVVVLAGYQLYSLAASMPGTRARLASAPGVAEREQCMIEGGHPELIPFARWLNARVPEDTKIAYVAASFDHPCFQFALLPRMMVDDPASARYVFYLDPPDAPTKARLKREYAKPEAEREVEFYAPTWALEDKG